MHTSALRPHGEPGDSTTVGLLIFPSFPCVAHCGDSCAVLNRASAMAFSTEDHGPLLPLECEGIHDSVGTICLWHLKGSMTESRALGNCLQRGSWKAP